jgi:hypothetical protein
MWLGSNMEASQLARTYKAGEQDGRVAQADRHVVEVPIHVCMMCVNTVRNVTGARVLRESIGS